ncbi:MAG: hypothetical protein KDK23_17345 [Leptospiraceae bacterium]|nr:hypothetical protein [Leptospiraceae bacterium]
MLNPDQTTRILELLAREVCSHTDSRDYSDLALYLLDTGYDSLNCRIIAGMQSAYKVEIEPYFRALLDETGLGELQYKDDFLIQFLASRHCQDVLAGNLDPIEVLAPFHSLWLASQFDPLYSPFVEIIDAMELLKEGYSLLEGLTENNIDEFIRKTCDELLKQLDLQKGP